MKQITKALAFQMESCIKQTHIEVSKQYDCGQVLEINGGAACFSGFDSYLSQVVAWGFSSGPSDYLNELRSIEQFYKTLGHDRLDIEFCPYAGQALALFLSERAYQITELNNVSCLDLDHFKPLDLPKDEFTIRQMASDEVDAWAEQVALGFNAPEAQDQFARYARAQPVLAFGAFHEHQLVAGATVAMHGSVCDLGVTSTLPAYRGLKLQKRLIMARLNLVKKKGLKLATVTTEPGSISDLNIQKLGFSCAYTRIKLSAIAHKKRYNEPFCISKYFK